MDIDSQPNLMNLFFDQAATLGDKPFLWAKRDGTWQSWSWSETRDKVTHLGRGIRNLGINPGDRVALVSENRPEWAVADFAIMSIGAITVPAYTTNTVDDHLHILNNSGARGVIVSTARLAQNLLEAAHQADTVEWVICIEEPDLKQALSIDVHQWDKVMATGADLDFDVETKARSLDKDDTAIIIYTSGTGGTPKGVMLHHRSIMHNCKGAQHVLQMFGLDNEVFLSFLPLSHSYEHTAGLMFPMSIGAEIYYAESIEKLAANMAECHPTLMTAVPRLYETMRGKILTGVAKQGGAKEKLFHATVELGSKKYLGESLGLVGSLKNALLDVLVRKKVAGRFGGRLKAFVSGGGPLNQDVGLFFIGLGVRILQGYGQTESGPVVSVNTPTLNKVHTVGPAFIETEVKIAEDGEILLKGDLVMKGYWNNPDATSKTIVDGWLHTGDVGVIDEDGYIQITDRKKDIIVNSGGDNIAPQRVEGFLTLEAEIAQAMVYGDKRPSLVGLIVPDEDFARAWAKEHNKDYDLALLCADQEFRKTIQEAVARVNTNLSNIEKVRKFELTPEAFAIDNEQLTPTLKIRRHVIKAVYGDRLEALY